METTSQLGLQITTEDTLGVDHPNDTIVAYGENFKKLEDSIASSASGTTGLETGREYKQGHIIWNSKPTAGGYAGWVNVRTGIHANPKKTNTAYKDGDIVSSPNDTGFYYKCIRPGTTPNLAQQNMGASVEKFDEVSTSKRWGANHTYTVNEVILATSHDTTYYLMCTIAGTSGALEPVWTNHKNGQTITDGTVTWKKLGNIRWERMSANTRFMVFGKIGES